MDEMAERFARDTAGHELILLRDDGPYRHLRFGQALSHRIKDRRPNLGSFYWFDLVTWPGSLAINGDCGSFTFSRVQDMFEFFRDGARWGINPGYWAEKVRAADPSGVKRYSPELFRKLVAEYIGECGGDWPGLAEAVEDKIFGEFAEWNTEYVEGAHEALNDFRHGADPLAGEPGFSFADSWEWDLTDWNWQYLWCCHAIQWGISQYDKQKAPAAGRVTAGTLEASNA